MPYFYTVVIKNMFDFKIERLPKQQMSVIASLLSSYSRYINIMNN